MQDMLPGMSYALNNPVGGGEAYRPPTGGGKVMSINRRKLAANDLLQFLRLPAAEKKGWVEKLRPTRGRPAHTRDGDYWDRAVKAAHLSFQQQDLRVVDTVIAGLRDKIGATRDTIVQEMYQCNIDLLHTYRSLDLMRLRPAVRSVVYRELSGREAFPHGPLDVAVQPGAVFSFRQEGQPYIGGTWFLARKGGFPPEERALLCELLHRFLQHQYGKRYRVHPDYCTVVDLVHGIVVDHRSLVNSGIGAKLDGVLEEIVDWVKGS
jgi:hypothetical protein